MPVEITFSESIKELSPKFVKIFNQAHFAEQLRALDELVGPGYRKALEFLVKDFAIKEHPEAEEEIKRKLLSPCIQEYLEDERIRRCATSASWLGNDQTHYVQRWTDRDIADLKTLVTLTKNWIENVYLTRQMDLTDNRVD